MSCFQLTDSISVGMNGNDGAAEQRNEKKNEYVGRRDLLGLWKRRRITRYISTSGFEIDHKL